MNEGVQGLFSGIGNAMAETGQQGVNDYFQKSRLKMRQKLNAESAEKDREFQKEQAKTQDQRERERLRLRAKLNKEGQQSSWEDVTDEQGNIVGQRNVETNKFQPIQRSEGSAEMDPYTEYTSDVLMTELKHLNKLESQLDGGNEQGMLPGDSVYRKNRLQKIKLRKETVQEKMQLLSGPPTEAQIIAEAGRIPEEDRDEFLDDLRSNPNSDDNIVKKVQRYWSLDDETQQPLPEPEPQGGQGQNEPRQDENNQPQPQSAADQWDGNVLQKLIEGRMGGQKEASSEVQVPLRRAQKQGSQQEQSGQGSEQKQGSEETTPISGDPTYEGDNRLGPAIERGVDWLLSRPQEWKKERVQGAVKEMERIAVEGPPKDEKELRGFFAETAPYINQAPKEIRQQMIEIFGEERLKPFLERR